MPRIPQLSAHANSLKGIKRAHFPTPSFKGFSHAYFNSKMFLSDLAITYLDSSSVLFFDHDSDLQSIQPYEFLIIPCLIHTCRKSSTRVVPDTLSSIDLALVWVGCYFVNNLIQESVYKSSNLAAR